MADATTTETAKGDGLVGVLGNAFGSLISETAKAGTAAAVREINKSSGGSNDREKKERKATGINPGGKAAGLLTRDNLIKGGMLVGLLIAGLFLFKSVFKF